MDVDQINQTAGANAVTPKREVSPRRQSLRALLLTHELAFLALVVIAGAVGGVWAYLWQQSSHETIRLNFLSHTAQEIRTELHRQIREVSVASLRNDPNAKQLNTEYARRMRELFNELRRNSGDRAEDYAIQEMQTAFSYLQADLRETLSDLFALNRLVRSEWLDPAFEQQFVADFERSYADFDALVGRRLGMLESKLSERLRIAPYAMSIPILIAVILLLFSRHSLASGFIQPMRSIMEGQRTLSAGQLEHRLPVEGVAELGELASGINQMADELQKSRDALLDQERQAALGALVPVVAHNVRNPLAAIKANAQLLDETSDPEEVAEVRDAVVDTVDNLDRWVTALVSYLHPLQPHTEHVAACDLLERAIGLLEHRLNEQRIRCVRQPWNQAATIAADPSLLEQALYGLLNNAVDASHPGSEIRVGVHRQDDAIVLEIEDTAGGIPFQPEPTELEPGPSTKRFGTGLGIPIAFKICGTHGYRLEFKIEQGRGTIASIVAPGITE